MTERLSSSDTLIQGMSAIKYGTDAPSGKRPLADMIRVSWLPGE